MSFESFEPLEVGLGLEVGLNPSSMSLRPIYYI